MTGWEVYWLTRLDAIHHISGAVALFGLVLGGIAGIFFCIFIAVRKFNPKDEDAAMFYEATRRIALALLIPGMVAIAINTFVPTLRESAAIYLIPPIVNNEDVQEIPADAAKLLHNKLEGWMDDTAPQGNTKEKK